MKILAVLSTLMHRPVISAEEMAAQTDPQDEKIAAANAPLGGG